MQPVTTLPNPNNPTADNSTPDWQALLAQDMQLLDAELQKQLQSNVPLVGEVASYIIQSGGKRLRPALLLLCANSLGCVSPHRHTLAAVIEFIHTATLLHDDVVDDSQLRRGQPTANHRFGNPASVLVGDFLYSRAFQMMVQVGDMRVLEVLSNATNAIAEGEVLQLMNIKDADLDQERYFGVIRSKTAQLFEAGARLGAIVAGAGKREQEICAAYGQAVGVAFQIIDDILDYDGDVQVLGKNLGDDLREGKVTLPLIVALQNAKPQDKLTLMAAIEDPSDTALYSVLNIIKQTKALDTCYELAYSQAEQALCNASLLPNSPYRDAMVELGKQLVTRKY